MPQLAVKGPVVGRPTTRNGRTKAATQTSGAPSGVVLCSTAEGKPEQVQAAPGPSAREVPWGQIAPEGASLVTHVGCFTPAYAPPEAFAGRSSRSFDQYSLALTFCALAFGQMPFHGTMEEQIRQRNRGALDLSFLPESLRPPLRTALAPAPERRFASCQALIDAVRDACLPLVQGCREAVAYLDW